MLLTSPRAQLALSVDPTPAPDPAPAGGAGLVLRAGVVFRSRGLNAQCEVLSVDGGMVAFRVLGGTPLVCDVPLDQAVAHLAAGRWEVIRA